MMKKEILFFLVSIFFIPNLYSQIIVDTSIQNKNVLFEIVCGVRDGHTPPLHDTAKMLAAKYPNNFFPIIIHAGQLARPHKNDINLRTVYGERLDKLFRMFDNSIGASGLYSYMNRHDFNSRNKAYFSYSTRAEISIYTDSVLNNELAYANIGLDVNLDTSSRSLNIKCQVYYTANSSVVSNKLHIALLQNNIESLQSNYFGDTSLDNTIPALYKQPFLLRDYITDSMGVLIDNVNTALGKMKLDTAINYQIPYFVGNIPVEVDDISIVAFVTEGNDDFEVVNVTGVKPSKLTGIVSEKKENKIKIYPNPVLDKLHIENLSDRSTIQIFNQLGELVCRRTNISSQETIDMTSYIQGVYFIYVSSTNSNYYCKFIKM